MLLTIVPPLLPLFTALKFKLCPSTAASAINPLLVSTEITTPLPVSVVAAEPALIATAEALAAKVNSLVFNWAKSVERTSIANWANVCGPI